jgi:serine/threonine protein phosphatase PrpC
MCWRAHGVTIARAAGDNQDAAAWSRSEDPGAVQWGVVADGHGGRPGGAAAARTAVLAASTFLTRLAYLPSTEELLLLGRVCDERVRDEGEAGFTTLCLAVVSMGRGRILRCGDSRAYLFQPAPDGGLLTQVAEAAPQHPLLGSGQARFGVNRMELSADQVLLICSDGLLDVLGEPEVRDCLAACTADPASDLLQTARRRAPGGFSDDVSVVTLSTVVAADQAMPEGGTTACHSEQRRDS